MSVAAGFDDDDDMPIDELFRHLGWIEAERDSLPPVAQPHVDSLMANRERYRVALELLRRRRAEDEANREWWRRMTEASEQ